MKKLILLHAVIEIIAGVVILFRPDLVLLGTDLATDNVDNGMLILFIAKLYAITVFTLGAICFFIYRMFEYSKIFKKIVMIVMAFHLMIALQLYTGFNHGLVSNIGPFGLHMVLAALFAIVYMKEINLFQEEKK